MISEKAKQLWSVPGISILPQFKTVKSITNVLTDCLIFTAVTRLPCPSKCSYDSSKIIHLDLILNCCTVFILFRSLCVFFPCGPNWTNSCQIDHDDLTKQEIIYICTRLPTTSLCSIESAGSEWIIQDSGGATSSPEWVFLWPSAILDL